jgi:hypothetical protein
MLSQHPVMLDVSHMPLEKRAGNFFISASVGASAGWEHLN